MYLLYYALSRKLAKLSIVLEVFIDIRKRLKLKVYLAYVFKKNVYLGWNTLGFFIFLISKVIKTIDSIEKIYRN